MAVDFHVHTTASDGSLTPVEVVELAKKQGLTAIGITDHDTMNGVEVALKKGKEIGLQIIPGVELNTDYQDSEIHILGYFLDYQDQKLKQIFIDLSEMRFNRAKKMVDKLNELGILIKFERVLEIAGEGTIGRPHVAKAIIEKGYATDFDEVFSKLIGRQCPAYVPRSKLTPFSAVELINEFGGVPVLAHPGLNDADEIIPGLIEKGLKGIEVYHIEHTEEDKLHYLKIAEEYGLITTGGTDYHGPGIRGVFLGQVKLSQKYLADLMAARLEMKVDNN